MDKKIISLVLGIMCFLLTLGIVVQIKTVNRTGTTVSTNSKENELRDAVLKAKEKYDNLYDEVERMENLLETERTNSTQNNTELTELENTIKEGNKISGLSEVTGDGIIITLNDGQITSSNSWYVDINDVIVHDLDLIRTVNYLKNTGAEAISINGQRIISTTAIECDGNVIMINGEKIGAPFEIKAIGFPETLINIDMTGGYVQQLRDRGVEVTVTKSDKEKITIPKYSGVIKYEYLQSQ